jgi:hypothetical protein
MLHYLLYTLNVHMKYASKVCETVATINRTLLILTRITRASFTNMREYINQPIVSAELGIRLFHISIDIVFGVFSIARKQGYNAIGPERIGRERKLTLRGEGVVRYYGMILCMIYIMVWYYGFEKRLDSWRKLIDKSKGSGVVGTEPRSKCQEIYKRKLN